jgi:hypothetical protein
VAPEALPKWIGRVHTPWHSRSCRNRGSRLPEDACRSVTPPKRSGVATVYRVRPARSEDRASVPQQTDRGNPRHPKVLQVIQIAPGERCFRSAPSGPGTRSPRRSVRAPKGRLRSPRRPVGSSDLRPTSRGTCSGGFPSRRLGSPDQSSAPSATRWSRGSAESDRSHAPRPP